MSDAHIVDSNYTFGLTSVIYAGMEHYVTMGSKSLSLFRSFWSLIVIYLFFHVID